MAGAFSDTNVKFDLHVTCCLGDHPLRNPKLLPCQHSFCLKCIKAKIGQNRWKFICPKCQLSIPLTKKDVDQLPDDFLYPILQKSKISFDCEMCKFDNKNVKGTFQCLDCGDVLCVECKAGHTKSSLTRRHSVVSVKEIKSGKYRNRLETKIKLLCQTHSKRKSSMFLEYYCEECKCLACQTCNQIHHKPQGHTCKTIDEIYEKKAKAIADHVANLVALKQLDEDFVVKLEQGQGESKTQREKLENEVYERAALIIDIVEKVKQDKLTEIKGHFEKEDISMQTKLDETKNRMIRTDSIMSYTQTFLEHSEKQEFLQHKHEIMKNLKENRQHHDRTLKITAFEIEGLQIQNIESVMSEAFGRIKVKTKARDESIVKGASPNGSKGPVITDPCSEKSASPDLVEETKTSKASQIKDVPREWLSEPEVLSFAPSCIGPAPDLTVADNGVIVSANGSIIMMYDSCGLRLGRIHCSQLKNASNVVAKGDNLYVSDRDGKGTVFVMDFTGNVKKTITLPLTWVIGHGDIGLAVDDEGTVYMSSSLYCKIYKCGPTERNAKEFIELPPFNSNGSSYLCVTPDGEVVLSNHDGHSVHIYSRIGELLWQYKGQGDMLLDPPPRGVCCDNQGHIYISDRKNERIQVVKNGKFLKCIKLDGSSSPAGIEGNIICGFFSGGLLLKLKIWE